MISWWMQRKSMQMAGTTSNVDGHGRETLVAEVVSRKIWWSLKLMFDHNMFLLKRFWVQTICSFFQHSQLSYNVACIISSLKYIHMFVGKIISNPDFPNWSHHFPDMSSNLAESNHHFPWSNHLKLIKSDPFRHSEITIQCLRRSASWRKRGLRRTPVHTRRLSFISWLGLM